MKTLICAIICAIGVISAQEGITSSGGTAASQSTLPQLTQEYFYIEDEFIGRMYQVDLNANSTNLVPIGSLPWEMQGFASNNANVAGRLDSRLTTADTVNLNFGVISIDVDTARDPSTPRGVDISTITHGTNLFAHANPVNGLTFSFTFVTGTKLDSLYTYMGLIKWSSVSYPLTQADTLTNRIIFASGLPANASADSLYLICANGTARTKLAIALMQANTRYTVAATVVGTTVNAYLNGTLKGNISTNVPAATSLLQIHFGLANLGFTAIGVGKKTYWSRFQMYMPAN